MPDTTNDTTDDAISAFERRANAMTHHASCTTTEAPKRTDDWSLVDCPTCLRSETNPANGRRPNGQE